MPSARRSTLGARLRATRLAAGMSQSVLAEACGIPKPRLSQYENDHLVPSIGTLGRIGRALGISEGALLDADDLDVLFLAEVRRLGGAFRDADDARAAAAEVARRRSRVRRTAG